MSDSLESQLKNLIVTTLKLEDIVAADLPDNEPLFGSGLNLDSIDVLELVVTLERRFGIKIATSEEARAAFGSISQLATFIRERAPKDMPSK